MEKKKLVVALGAGIAVSLSASVLASQGSSNPFQTSTMTAAYNGQSGQLQLAAQDSSSAAGAAKQAMGKCGKGKCGKGKCGGSKAQDGKKANGGCGGKQADGSCGGKKADGSCGGKKADGNCGVSKAGEATDASGGDAGAANGGS